MPTSTWIVVVILAVVVAVVVAGMGTWIAVRWRMGRQDGRASGRSVKSSGSWPRSSGGLGESEGGVIVRTEFLEKLVLRSLRLEYPEDLEALDPSDPRASSRAFPQPGSPADARTGSPTSPISPAWQDPTMMPLAMEETLRREQEELDRRILFYQTRLATTTEEYEDSERTRQLHALDERESNPSGFSDHESTLPNQQEG